MTNQLCLQEQCGRLYKKIVRQIACYETTTTDEKKWIEWGFSITTKAWLYIQETVQGYQFTDQEEEIGFYKTLKPKFIALMDFFTLLYRSVLFQPEDTTGKKEYWKSELTTCKNFLLKHKTFCRYYEQGNCSMDPVYFVQENNQHPLIFGINENKRAENTSYSYLLARVLSIRKYQRYVSKKLNEGAAGNLHFPEVSAALLQARN
ncbi:hypothetical protein A3860_21860 [Niastella vici]|uniref:Uncharacterized protein n=1 Tax=Niastella vici TaxID=1703345 RepID=A0A1V9G0B2_9BACT|nr:RteC domain-containing protein [Niastella vici]OQP64059.1 hypothetical protein A3860_21860 [Niastella vici]